MNNPAKDKAVIHNTLTDILIIPTAIDYGTKDIKRSEDLSKHYQCPKV
jgi:hypothetical protein